MISKLKSNIVYVSLLIALTTLTLMSGSVGAAPPAQGSEGQEYIVQAGDWLSKISEKYYGDILSYPFIFEATNRKAAQDTSFAVIVDPDLIEVGQKLWLPPASALMPDAEFYLNRGVAFYKLGDYEQAIADLDKAIALNPDYADAYYYRGNAYYFVGEYEQAIANYTKAIELDPDNADAYGYLCWFSSLLGHAADVIETCERGVELAPDNGGIRDSRGLARALIGDYEGAIEDFKFYVEWSKENGRYEQRGVKREAWIAELEAGRNPFDEATLQELMEE